MEDVGNKYIVNKFEEDKKYVFQVQYESVIKGWCGVPGMGREHQRLPPEPPPIMDVGLEDFRLITDGKYLNLVWIFL